MSKPRFSLVGTPTHVRRLPTGSFFDLRVGEHKVTCRLAIYLWKTRRDIVRHLGTYALVRVRGFSAKNNRDGFPMFFVAEDIEEEFLGDRR